MVKTIENVAIWERTQYTQYTINNSLCELNFVHRIYVCLHCSFAHICLPRREILLPFQFRSVFFFLFFHSFICIRERKIQSLFAKKAKEIAFTKFAISSGLEEEKRMVNVETVECTFETRVENLFHYILISH